MSYPKLNGTAFKLFLYERDFTKYIYPNGDYYSITTFFSYGTVSRSTLQSWDSFFSLKNQTSKPLTTSKHCTLYGVGTHNELC